MLYLVRPGMHYTRLQHSPSIHQGPLHAAAHHPQYAGTAAAAGGEGGSAALEATIAPALASCEAALGRCLKLTSGTALPALARVLDRAVQQYVSVLQAAVASLRGRLAEGGGEAEGAEAVLPLLTVASQLVQRLALLEASLRQAAAEAALLLEGPAGGTAAAAAAAAPSQLPSAAELRLAAQSALRRQLAAFAANAGSGAQLLPLATSAAADLEQSVGAAVLEVLTVRPHAQLAPLPRLAEWQQRGGAGGLPLPTFSAYPLQYATSGEEGGGRWGALAGTVCAGDTWQACVGQWCRLGVTSGWSALWRQSLLLADRQTPPDHNLAHPTPTPLHPCSPSGRAPEDAAGPDLFSSFPPTPLQWEST